MFTNFQVLQYGSDMSGFESSPFQSYTDAFAGKHSSPLIDQVYSTLETDQEYQFDSE